MTSTEAGARRSFFGARIVFVLVSLAVTAPSPGALLWGGAAGGDYVVPTLLGAAWGALVLVGALLGRRFEITSAEGQRVLGLSLCADVLLVTVLLATNGAAQNPFTLLYFVPITLVTMVAPRWTVPVAGLSVVGFGLLLLQTSLALTPHAQHPHHAHFFQHVRGMAIALAVVGGFVTYFVHRIARALFEQRRKIEELSREQQENRFAIALGALSAGAAHELGSPLGTVQLLAEEIPHLEEADRVSATRTIAREVQRMKRILHGMDSSELSAHVLGDESTFAWSEIASEFGEQGVEIHVDSTAVTRQPRKVIEQMGRELLRNARRADPVGRIVVEIGSTSTEIWLAVIDQGPGLTPEQLQRAREPFVSDSGGMGLGLFLASVHARQLGGRLELSGAPGGGLRAELVLPRDPPLSLKGRKDAG